MNIKTIAFFAIIAASSAAAFSPSSPQVTLNTHLNYRSDGLFEAPAEPLPSAIESRRAIPNKSSPVQSIRTIEQYNTQVHQEMNKLVIVRFHAPWCRMCKFTNVAYERMASKFQKLSPHSIKFMSVYLDGSDETNQLKDMLGVEGVPFGLVRFGGMSKRVNLNRANMGMLKRQLRLFVENDGELDFDML